MAQEHNQLDPKRFHCSICLDLLSVPVTIHCGHSYCMECICSHWNKEAETNISSCPQCRRTFKPRPHLVKNIMLADLVEELRKTGLPAAPADHCSPYAGAEDVACDVCTGSKLKAVKSCLVCSTSYCEEHLQPHHQSPALKEHKLVEPSQNLQEKICSHHNEVMKMFCRTDQQCICFLCPVDQHKGHDTVSVAAERTLRQRRVEMRLQEIQQRVQDRETELKVLQQKVEAVNVSADKAVEESEKVFTEQIRFLEKRCSEVRQQIRSQQEREVSAVKDVEEKLQQELTELRRTEAELKQLSHTREDNMFLLKCPSLSDTLRPSPHLSSVNVRPLSYFEDVTAAVSQVRGRLQHVLTGTWTNVIKKVTQVEVPQPEPEPEMRDEFLQYSREITLDPNTAHGRLLLSEGDRKVTVMREDQSDCPTDCLTVHPDRFTYYPQVLSRQSLTGRCYWEVEWRGGEVGRVRVAVAYKNIHRAGESYECFFGNNVKSWSLYCDKNNSIFIHNNVMTKVPELGSSCRLGVYLDHSAGVLSFYRVSDTMTVLHRVQTAFTQPLHAGLCLYFNSPGATAEFCKLK